MFSRVSSWLLSDRREDRIDDLVQEMEASGFWLLDTRQIVANILLKNIELLQSIKLNGNEVDHSGLEAIGNCCILLRKLSLNKCRGVTDEGLSFLATKLKELRKLNISRCRKITEISVDNVTKSCTFLTSLKMKSCYLISKEAFAFIGERCHHLKKLDLTDTEVDDAGLMSIASCAELSVLRLAICYNLRGNGLIKVGKFCQKLIELNLYRLINGNFGESYGTLTYIQF